MRGLLLRDGLHQLLDAPVPLLPLLGEKVNATSRCLTALVRSKVRIMRGLDRPDDQVADEQQSRERTRDEEGAVVENLNEAEGELPHPPVHVTPTSQRRTAPR